MSSNRFVATLKRIPFTVAMVLIVAAIGIATATHLARLEPGLMKRFGFAPLHLPRGEWVRLFTSAFLTHGGWSFYRSLAMLALCLGLSEYRVGTWRTTLAFWSVHLATLSIVSLLLAFPLYHVDVVWRKLLAAEHDVGPSAGYYGCLGFVCQKWPEKRRHWLYALIGGVLLARLVWAALSPRTPHALLGADMAHLVAFPLGIALGRFVLRN
jgi:membrane associated rhomboid family serine protease